MFAETRYISWATRFYGKVPFDLASSGIPTASSAELAALEPARTELDDLDAYTRLRDAIARYAGAPAAEVVPALGTSHAIFLAYACLLSAGDEIVVETPGYEPLTRAAEGLGARVVTFERRAEEGYQIVPERVAAAIGPRTRAIVVSTLHNPTGVRASEEALKTLAAIAEARGAYLIVDEVYAPFDALPETGVLGVTARSLAPNVIACSSLTKCYGLGYHRLGWMLGPPELVRAAEHATITTVGHLPLAYAARGAAVFAGLGALATRARAHLEGKRAIVDAWVNEQPDLGWSAPTAGLFGMATPAAAKDDLRPAIEAWAETHGVLVGAGSFFGAPRSFRLSWATLAKPELASALDRLGSLLPR